MITKNRILGAVAAASLLAGALLYATRQRQAKPPANQVAAATALAPAVQVVEALGRTLPETASYTGRLVAVEHVDLRPRVGGYVAAVRFREGSMVRRGQLLFEIDARPYRAAVARAQAQLQQARARRELAERRAIRARVLRAADVISPAELEAASAEEADSAASVEAARASLHAAYIDLADTRVRAPIDGRVGEALVTAGNLVTGGGIGASRLTTLVSIDPLHVEFDVDEAIYRLLSGSRDRTAAVRVLLGDGSEARSATVDFVANGVDRATGTARVRAVLPNPDGRLASGLFVRVEIETAAPRAVTLVRDESVGTTSEGRQVLVVRQDGTVEARMVELGERIGVLRVVRAGLAPGELVVLKGMARPGMKVTPRLPSSTTGGAS